MVLVVAATMEPAETQLKKPKEHEGKYLKTHPIEQMDEDLKTEDSNSVVHITSDDNGKGGEERKKGILKHSRTYSNKHVDFNMDLEFVPFDETKDYTIEIQIVEQMPKKVVSYAALFAEQKAQEEAEKHKNTSETENKKCNEKSNKVLNIKKCHHIKKEAPLAEKDIESTENSEDFGGLSSIREVKILDETPRESYKMNETNEICDTSKSEENNSSSVGNLGFDKIDNEGTNSQTFHDSSSHTDGYLIEITEPREENTFYKGGNVDQLLLNFDNCEECENDKLTATNEKVTLHLKEENHLSNEDKKERLELNGDVTVTPDKAACQEVEFLRENDEESIKDGLEMILDKEKVDSFEGGTHHFDSIEISENAEISEMIKNSENELENCSTDPKCDKFLENFKTCEPLEKEFHGEINVDLSIDDPKLEEITFVGEGKELQEKATLDFREENSIAEISCLACNSQKDSIPSTTEVGLALTEGEIEVNNNQHISDSLIIPDGGISCNRIEKKEEAEFLELPSSGERTITELSKCLEAGIQINNELPLNIKDILESPEVVNDYSLPFQDQSKLSENKLTDNLCMKSSDNNLLFVGCPNESKDDRSCDSNEVNEVQQNISIENSEVVGKIKNVCEINNQRVTERLCELS